MHGRVPGRRIVPEGLEVPGGRERTRRGVGVRGPVRATLPAVKGGSGLQRRGRNQNLCIGTGPQGSFCGVGCADDSECPDGFSCVEVVADRAPVKQCRPKDSAECPCSDASKTLGLKTDCWVENASGKCFGERTCDQACDAPIPVSEICNDQDDD